MQEPKKRGRPAKPAAERRRHNQTFRCTDDMLAKLQAAAEEGQRSLSEEVERRIEQSFAKPDIVKETSRLTIHELQYQWYGSKAMFDNAIVYSKLLHRFLDTKMSLEQYKNNKKRAKELLLAAHEDLIDHLFMALAHQKEFELAFEPLNDGTGAGKTSFKEMELAFKMAKIQADVLSHLMPTEYTSEEIEWNEEVPENTEDNKKT